MPARLVFMGSDAIALPALDWLAGAGRARAELAGVFTQPDRPHGRGQRLQPGAIKTWALARGLPVHQPERLVPQALEDLAALRADAVLVMAYGHILRQSWLDTPPCGVWNLHASLLPKLRGASPIQGAIASGETQTGISLMRMAAALDAGPVLDCERVAIGPLETGETLEAKLAGACVPLLQRNLEALFTDAPALAQQDDAHATFTRRLRKDDGRLDFRVSAAALARRINALHPWPGAGFECDGEAIRAGLAEAVPGPSPAAAPGTVLAAREALVVAAGEGTLRLLRLQRPGGRMLPAAEFLRGRAIEPGSVIPSREMPELVRARPFQAGQG
jgi:methionyl-tRNA formyltransferase